MKNLTAYKQEKYQQKIVDMIYLAGT